VDRAFADLEAAETAYRAVHPLPSGVRLARELVPVASDPRARFRDALCGPCRLSLVTDVGTTARHALRRALSRVPTDLAWFEVCCDGCYRLYQEALVKARFGLVDDAERAWWLASFSLPDLETAPPSLGRYIAALHESERRAYRNVDERRPFCQTALDVGLALGAPRLVAQARIYLANLERLASRLDEADRLLKLAAGPSRGMPWLEALYLTIQANVEVERKAPAAFEPLREAFSLYEPRDPHLAALVLIRKGMLEFFMGSHEQTLETFQAARVLVDGRRDPTMAGAVLPLNLTAALGRLGELTAARETLESCDFDRTALPALAALEEFHWACLHLAHGRASQALALFVGLRTTFEKLKQPLQVALVTLYSVDALVGVGRRDEAMVATGQAARYLKDAGFGHDEQRALAKLRELLTPEVVDATAVSVAVRELARRCAGWVPAPCQTPAGEPRG
jgi:tetratricopeptide (TPR) repeat protein